MAQVSQNNTDGFRRTSMTLQIARSYSLVDWSRRVRRVCQRQREMYEIRLHEPSPAIDRQGRRIISPGFYMYGTDSAARAEVPHFCHRRLAQPRAAKLRLDKEVVHNGTKPAICHAVA